jgi:hypothetical protein
VINDLKEAIECAQIDLHFAAAELNGRGSIDQSAALLHMEQAANQLVSSIRSWRERLDRANGHKLDANHP